MKENSFRLENNSFDVIRYFAAFSVMLLHYTYYAILFSEQEIATLRGIRRITEIFPGVVILFSLSGFLISASLERCKTKKEFFVKRIFRLYPELWLCTFINLIVVICLARERLDGSIFLWICTQIVGIANTPSCLKDFATGSINGALWTIFTEVQLYVILGVIYPWLKKMKRNGWILLMSASVIMNLVCKYITDHMDGAVDKIVERIFIPYFLWFLIGVFCYQNREWVIPTIKKYIWILILIFAINQGFHVCSYGYYEDIVSGILLPFIIIGLAYLLPVKRIKCDLSYGMFLYHWIVLNVMVHLNVFGYMPWQICAIIFIIVTLLTAWLSWYLVRKKYDRHHKKAI